MRPRFSCHALETPEMNPEYPPRQASWSVDRSQLPAEIERPYPILCPTEADQELRRRVSVILTFDIDDAPRARRLPRLDGH